MNGRMVTDEEVDRVKALLASGWSQRRVARFLGVSKTCVSKISQGTFREYSRTLGRFTPVRCPTCGGRVRMPCKLCAVRSQKGAL